MVLIRVVHVGQGDAVGRRGSCGNLDNDGVGGGIGVALPVAGRHSANSGDRNLGVVNKLHEIADGQRVSCSDRVEGVCR